MEPELRAIADRFMYETATLRHIVALLPDGALQRPAPGLEWTVGQLLGHLGQSLTEYAAIVERWLAGEPAIPPGWDPDTMNAETARQYANATERQVFDLLGAGINALVAALAKVPDGRLGEPLGPAEARRVLHTFEGHALGHAIPLVDGVPEVRMDPLVLNWLLYATFSQAEEREWQRRLVAEARDYVAAHAAEEDDE